MQSGEIDITKQFFVKAFAHIFNYMAIDVQRKLVKAQHVALCFVPNNSCEKFNAATKELKETLGY